MLYGGSLLWQAGRFRMCSAALCTSIAEELFIISRLSRSAERSKRIFTRGDVVENGSCSAAFCESAALWADQRFQWGRMQLPATFGPCPQEIHSGKIRRFSYIANYNGFTLSIPSTTQEHTRLLRCKTKKAIVFAFLHQRWLRIGAADEARTRYLHLGKVALYQMSYGRTFHLFLPVCCPATLVIIPHTPPVVNHKITFF